MHRLRIGFPDTTPEDEAVARAKADWREACEREGHDAEPVSVRVIRDDPARTAMGEYLIEVAHGDQS